MSQNEANYGPVTRSADVEGQGPDHPGGTTAPNPLLIVHSLLRGRYLRAIVLALLGAGVGAAAGYRSQKPQYQSVGIIRIKPTIPSGQPMGQDTIMPAFEAFVKSQQAFMLSERVISKAMEKPEWQALRPGLAPEAIVSFRAGLEVFYDKGELIKVLFTDVDPAVAMAGVKCVTTSYLELFGNSESADGVERLGILQKVRTEQSNVLRAKNAAIASIAGPDVDPDSLEKMHVQSLQETSTRESDWNEAQRLLAASDTSDAPTPPDGQAQTPTTAPADLTPRDIAHLDAGMRQLLAEQRSAERNLALVRRRYGPAHASFTDAQQRVAMATEDVEEYAETFRREAALRPNGEAVPLTAAEMALRALRVRERNLRRLYEESAAKTQGLGQKVVAIDTIKRDADRVKQVLDETNNAIRQLELQSSFGGRISAMSYGDQPLAPLDDKGTKFAAMGAVGGGGLGVALVLALGLLNRRLVSVYDAGLGMHRVDRMLGVLPHVPNDLADAGQAAVAAHCVHHIRTLLQLEPGLPVRRVYSVTSPSPGDGKTTLSIALGMSFAASGARTLLLDCDIIGGGLSSKMDPMIRPKIGRVLCREGLITEEQLKSALAAAKRTGRPLGEVLIAAGFVSPADVAHAAAVQSQSYVGLLDVLSGEPLADCVTGTGRPGLFILPLGSAGEHHASQLSPVALQAILAEARATYDVVLIDTGPILGSLEAAMAAAQSDAVVLTVSRGVSQAIVKRSLDRLGEVGAYVLGMVLNRAAAREVADFAFRSGSVRSGSARKLPSPEGGQVRPDVRLGRVGDAVAASAGGNRK
jgi:succinoglycan biosynthesis transport protein ExoP